MPTNRTPIKHQSHAVVTDTAISAFATMLKLDEDDEEWWLAHDTVWREMKAKLWEWPCVRRPDDPENPVGTEEKRWVLLEDALAERD
jgi:hypothetical protein